MVFEGEEMVEELSVDLVDLSLTLSILASVAAPLVPFGKDVAGTVVFVTRSCVPVVDSTFVSAPLSSGVVIRESDEDTDTVAGSVLVVVSSSCTVSVVTSSVVEKVVFDVLCVRSSVLLFDVVSVS